MNPSPSGGTRHGDAIALVLLLIVFIVAASVFAFRRLGSAPDPASSPSPPTPPPTPSPSSPSPGTPQPPPSPAPASTDQPTGCVDDAGQPLEAGVAYTLTNADGQQFKYQSNDVYVGADKALFPSANAWKLKSCPSRPGVFLLEASKHERGIGTATLPARVSPYLTCSTGGWGASACYVQEAGCDASIPGGTCSDPQDPCRATSKQAWSSQAVANGFCRLILPADTTRSSHLKSGKSGFTWVGAFDAGDDAAGYGKWRFRRSPAPA